MARIIIQSVQFKASRNLEEFVKGKVGRLFEKDKSVSRAEVTLFKGAEGNPENCFCEIQLSVPGKNHFVKMNSESYESSVLESVKILLKKIRRKKSKAIYRRRVINN